MALGIGNGDFPIEQGGAAWQIRKRLDQRSEFIRPVHCVTGTDDDSLARNRSDGTITVELNFVQPLIAAGRRIDESSELRFYEGGKLERGKFRFFFFTGRSGSGFRRFECQTFLPAAISFISRPVAMLSVSRSVLSFPWVRATSSFSLISSQLSLSFLLRARRRTSAQFPFSRSPCSVKLSLPFSIALSGFSCGSHQPQSHSITVPPPYSPFGMVPSKLPYLTGWSSTWTAR